MKARLRPLVAAALAIAAVAHAQNAGQRPSPHIGYLYPAGGQQGRTLTVWIGGQLLNGASAIHIAGGDVQAKITGYDRPLTQKELNDLREKVQELQEKRAAARADPAKPAFTAAEEKALAEARTLLASRPSRPANPALAEAVVVAMTIAPDATPGERELRVRTAAGLSNPFTFVVGELPETSEPVVTGTMIEPRQEPGKTDISVTLPATINGQILPGEADRFRFAARQGQRLTVAAAARALNPYLADAVPGWFQATLALYDAQGREVAYDDDFRFNPDPVLLFVVPADGDYTLEIKDALYRGREDFVYRIAIGELPFVASVFPLGGPVGAPLHLELAGWNLASDTLTLPTTGKAPGRFVVSVRNHGVLSNAAPFALDAEPECLDAEPNDRADTAQPIALPTIVNGRIERAGDEDFFRFEGRAGSVVVAEVVARRLGSPLDAFLELRDAAGRRLAFNDDFDDKAAGLLTHQADARLSATLPADGFYVVRIGDAQRRGGSDYAYRLRIGPPRPDFELRVAPATINLRAGASVPIAVHAVRHDGFDGEIALALADAHGFTLGGGRIPAKQDSVRLTLTAPPTPRDEPYDLAIAGRATIGGRTIVHVAVPAEDLMQAFAYHHLVVARELKASVIGRAAAFRVASRMPVQIPTTGKAIVRVLTPRNVGEIRFEPIEPVPGLTLRTASNIDGVAELELSWDPAKQKTGTQGNLLLNAFGERKNPATGKVQRTPLGGVPAISFDVVDPGPSA